MAKLKFQISMSVDGFITGPDPSEEHPLGIGGMELHEWAFNLDVWNKQHGREEGEHNASSAVIEEATANTGAVIMGRGMFGGGPGPWGDEPWQGWWGDDPPFHTPVFVLTHHEREPLKLNDTTFYFVTDGAESALEQARQAAGGKDVSIGGGANVLQQYLAAGEVDEMLLNVVPIMLGQGARMFAEDPATAGLKLTQLEVVDAPGVVHLKYGVG